MNATAIDPRGPRFNAALTSVVLAAVLLTGHTVVGVVLLAVQAALFGTAILLGVQRTPAAYLFRRFVRPRLAPPTSWEDPRPPRFAQGIGLVFALLGLVGLTAGPLWLGYAATALALAAALLNATIQLCLGCQIYGICRLPQDQQPRPTDQQNHTIDHNPTDDQHNKKEAIA